MQLAWLELHGFRSYERLHWVPGPGVNVLVGRNGAGKTNLIEAIGYLSSLRSVRGAPDDALVGSSAERAVIRGGISRSAGELRVEVEIPNQGRRRVLVNGKRPRRYSDVASEIPLVAFLPEDLDIVKRGPGGRRDYLDDLAAGLWPGAGARRSDYDKALRQRNGLLRQEGWDVDELALRAWDDQLAAAGAALLSDRIRLLGRLVPVVGEAYQRLGGGSAMSARYVSSWAGEYDASTEIEVTQAEATLRAGLKERRARDRDQRTTTMGPHRDDVTFLISGRPARTEASQGEQRSVALSLRLGAYELLRRRHDTPPLLVLDDVLSELDDRRRDAVVELLPRGQVFVTTAREDDVPVDGDTWFVDEGAVAPAVSESEEER